MQILGICRTPWLKKNARRIKGHWKTIILMVKLTFWYLSYPKNWLVVIWIVTVCHSALVKSRFFGKNDAKRVSGIGWLKKKRPPKNDHIEGKMDKTGSPPPPPPPPFFFFFFFRPAAKLFRFRKNGLQLLGLFGFFFACQKKRLVFSAQLG